MYARGLGAHKRQIHPEITDTVTIVRKSNNEEISLNKVIKTQLPNVNCTEMDLKILLGKICKILVNEDPGNFISVLYTPGIVREVIHEFEEKFNCRLDDAKKAYPQVKKDNELEYIEYVSYADLDYSI